MVMVMAPDINVSDHLPLTVVVKCDVYDNDAKLRYSAKPAQLQLRWDKGDAMSFYQ